MRHFIDTVESSMIVEDHKSRADFSSDADYIEYLEWEVERKNNRIENTDAGSKSMMAELRDYEKLVHLAPDMGDPDFAEKYAKWREAVSHIKDGAMASYALTKLA